MSKEQARTFYFLMLISLPVIFTNNVVNANSQSYSSHISASGVNNGQDEKLKVYSVVKDVRNSGEENGFIGAKQDGHAFNFNEESTTTDHPTPPTTTTEDPVSPLNPWYRMTTSRLVLMIIISFSIPVGFMSLLFWRLRKEKKYMNARAGALVYSETVLVPSYAISNSQNPDSNGDINVNQMYSTLYDTPPEYDAVVKPKTILEKSEKPKPEVQITTSEDIPPPAYSTVYI